MSDWDGPFELAAKFMILFGIVGIVIVAGILWIVFG